MADCVTCSAGWLAIHWDHICRRHSYPVTDCPYLTFLMVVSMCWLQCDSCWKKIGGQRSDTFSLSYPHKSICRMFSVHGKLKFQYVFHLTSSISPPCALVLNPISFLFLIIISDLICSMPAQWLFILDPIIVITFIFSHFAGVGDMNVVSS